MSSASLGHVSLTSLLFTPVLVVAAGFLPAPASAAGTSNVATVPTPAEGLTTALAKPEVNSQNPNLSSPQLLAQRVDNRVPVTSAPPAGLIPINQMPTLDRIDVYRSGYSGGSLILPPAGQVTSVSQLSDAQPTDWAFQALQALVERYGVIAGYPDGTYRGDRALTRYEFAAGLNAALDRVNELIAAGTADLATREALEELKQQLEALQTSQEDLAVGLDTQRLRINQLESQQFSTTTKLNAEVIFALAGVNGGTDVAGTSRIAVANPSSPTTTTAPLSNSTIFADRVRLNFDTSFTGKDRLRTRLQAQNITAFSGGVTGTNMDRLGFDGVGTGTNAANTVELDTLEYRFPVLGDRGRLTVAANTGRFEDVFPTLSPFASGGAGALSRFGRFNPIYRLQSGPGAILEYNFSPEFNVTVGYLTTNTGASNPAPGAGLFGSSYSLLNQLTYRPTSDFALAFLYARSYFTGAGLAGGTGSGFANAPFGAAGNSTANNYSVQAQWRVVPQFILAGWAGFQDANLEGPTGALGGFGTRVGQSASTFNWAVQLAFPDLFGKGNLAGIVVGQQPNVTSSTFTAGNTGAARNTAANRDGATNFHIEGFYRYTLSDNISITPGLIWILNPENNDRNASQWIGVVRTTFTF